MFPTQIYMRKTRHHSTPPPILHHFNSKQKERSNLYWTSGSKLQEHWSHFTLTVRDLSVLEAARRSRWRRGRGGPRCWLHLRNSDQTTADQQARRRSDPTWRLPSVYSVTSHTSQTQVILFNPSQNNSNNKTKAVERSPRASTKVHVHFYPGIKLFLQQCANINMTLLT